MFTLPLTYPPPSSLFLQGRNAVNQKYFRFSNLNDIV